LGEWRFVGVEREGGRPSVLHELTPEKDGGARISPLRISEWGATADRRSSVLHKLVPAPDLGVGRDNGWKVAGLARAGAGEGWKRISPFRVSLLRLSEWGTTVDGRPPVLHELASEKDEGARISEWGVTVNAGAARDGAQHSREAHTGRGVTREEHTVCRGGGAAQAEARRV
jgi:hypothetical protein